jgi:hypothetical protein
MIYFRMLFTGANRNFCGWRLPRCNKPARVEQTERAVPAGRSAALRGYLFSRLVPAALRQDPRRSGAESDDDGRVRFAR